MATFLGLLGGSSRVSLKVSYGVLVAVLDRGTGWEVLRWIIINIHR